MLLLFSLIIKAIEPYARVRVEGSSTERTEEEKGVKVRESSEVAERGWIVN